MVQLRYSDRNKISAAKTKKVSSGEEDSIAHAGSQKFRVPSQHCIKQC